MLLLSQGMIMYDGVVSELMILPAQPWGTGKWRGTARQLQGKIELHPPLPHFTGMKLRKWRGEGEGRQWIRILIK